MTKPRLFLPIILIFFLTNLCAQDFYFPELVFPLEEVTTARAKKIRLKGPVFLRGQVIKQVSKTEFLFQDLTGTIIVQINPQLYNNHKFQLEDQLVLWGEVQRGWWQTIIQVKGLHLLTKNQ